MTPGRGQEKKEGRKKKDLRRISVNALESQSEAAYCAWKGCGKKS